jgi:hypothetical protein
MPDLQQDIAVLSLEVPSLHLDGRALTHQHRVDAFVQIRVIQSEVRDFLTHEELPSRKAMSTTEDDLPRRYPNNELAQDANGPPMAKFTRTEDSSRRV